MNTSLKGVKFALAAAAVSGFAVFLNSFGVKLWQSSSGYTTAKNIVAALFLAALLVVLHKLPELKRLSGKTWGKLALIGFIGGSVPFLLFFKSLTLMSPVEAAFIHKTLFIWVAMLAYPFLKERLGIVQILALFVMLYAIYISGAPATWSFGRGAAMALGATILWDIESIIAKKILSSVSALTVAWARMFFGSFFLVVWLLSTGEISTIIPSSLYQGMLAIVVGIVLFGYVISWYSALEKAPATVVTSILALAFPITAVLDGVIVNHSLPLKVVPSILLMLAGILLITKQIEYYYSKFIKKGLVFSA